ncbi:MAG: hypothetical protein ACRCVN_05885 [Spirochaetia bacterium]
MFRIHEKIQKMDFLTTDQKILLNQITYLSTERPCYATDEYFVRFFKEKLGRVLSKKTIWRWIKKLEKHSLVQKLSAGSRRYLSPIFLQDKEKEDLVDFVKKPKPSGVVAVYSQPKVWGEDEIIASDRVFEKLKGRFGYG